MAIRPSNRHFQEQRRWDRSERRDPTGFPPSLRIYTPPVVPLLRGRVRVGLAGAALTVRFLPIVTVAGVLVYASLSSRASQENQN